jgi:hypothetical protein
MRQRVRCDETDRLRRRDLGPFGQDARLERSGKQRGELQIRELAEVALALDARWNVDGADENRLDILGTIVGCFRQRALVWCGAGARYVASENGASEGAL